MNGEDELKKFVEELKEMDGKNINTTETIDIDRLADLIAKRIKEKTSGRISY